MSELFSHRRRRQSDAEMDITPMIDITFLLLIFFLVASKMDQMAALQLPEARNGTAVTEQSSAILCLKAEGDRDVAIYKGSAVSPEHRLAGGDMDVMQRDLVEYISAELAGGKEQVILRAEKRIPFREVDRVMKALASIENVAIYVAVLEKE